MDSTVTQRFFQPLLLLFAHATDKQLAEYLEFLKAENRILWSKLPKRVLTTAAEKEKLVKLGKPLGKAIKDMVTIVSPRTFARCVSQEGKERTPAESAGKGGRPRKSDVREMVLKFAREGTGWGASRIHRELTKLGIRISDATVEVVHVDGGAKRKPVSD